jgi:hypothetical protein
VSAGRPAKRQTAARPGWTRQIQSEGLHTHQRETLLTTAATTCGRRCLHTWRSWHLPTLAKTIGEETTKIGSVDLKRALKVLAKMLKNAAEMPRKKTARTKRALIHDVPSNVPSNRFIRFGLSHPRERPL